MGDVELKPPHWLDDEIEPHLESGDPHRIARAIAESPRVIAAIKLGLANKPEPGVKGPSYAQNVRDAILDVMKRRNDPRGAEGEPLGVTVA